MNDVKGAGAVSGAVEAGELRKSYRSRAGEVRALDGLTFSVAPGSVFALLGPNGAGKTTAVRILTTLSRPDAGRTAVAGIDVLAHPGRVRQVIGVVTQHSGTVGLLTGQENLALQGRLYGVPPRDLKRRVAELLDQFEQAEKALARVPQVRRATAEGAVVRARVADGPRALPAVLAGLETDGIGVLSVTVARPSLDDVHLHHAGPSFRQAEGIAP